MANDDAKPWTPVCVASTEPQLERVPFPKSSPPSLRSSSASIKSELEDDYKPASLDPACNFYKSAEWLVPSYPTFYISGLVLNSKQDSRWHHSVDRLSRSLYQNIHSVSSHTIPLLTIHLTLE